MDLNEAKKTIRDLLNLADNDDAWNAGRSDGTRAGFSQGSARKAIG